MPSAGLKALPAPDTTDWQGRILPREYLRHLVLGCMVRCMIEGRCGSIQCLYFEITKIKDGTFWGKVVDIYRTMDCVGIEHGEEMSFRKEHTSEIPQERWWQPKAYRKRVAHLKPKDEGYAATGVRGQ